MTDETKSTDGLNSSNGSSNGVQPFDGISDGKHEEAKSSPSPSPSPSSAGPAAPAPFLESLKNVMPKLIPIGLVASVFTFLLLALFLGNSYNETALVNRANILVVDYDPGTPMSQGLLEFIDYWNNLGVTNLTGIIQTVPTLVYQNGPELFPLGVQQVIDRVETTDGNVYGAIVLAPNAYSTLIEALTNPNAPPYNSFAVTQIIYDEGFNMNFMDGFIFADGLVATVIFAYNFGETMVKDIVAPMLQNSTTAPVIVQCMINNPSAFSVPISFSLVNTHPVEPYTTSIVGSQITTTAVIFQFIFSMLTAIATYFITAALAAKFNVNVWHLQVFRILGVLSSSFFMSLFVAVQVPMFGGYMDSGFGPYWALVWFTMWGFQLIVMSLFVAFPRPLAGLLMISFLLSNVASGTFGAPLEITNNFYLYGYMMPFRATISAGRHLLFGSSNFLYRDMPILMAWIIVPIIVIFIGGAIERAQAIKAAAAAKNTAGAA